MIRFFSNRELSAKLGIKLSRWKRWSREFLPPDPLGGRQSGLARQYTVAEAFTVFLGGHLVADLNFAVPEARRILSDLQPNFDNFEFLNDFKTIKSASAAPFNRNTAVHIQIWRLPGSSSRPIRFGYRLSRRLQVRRMSEEGKQIVLEKLEELRLDNPESTPSVDDQLSWRTLNIGVLASEVF